MNGEKILLFIIRWGTYLALLAPLVIVDKFFFLFVGPKTLYFYGLTEIIFTAWLFLILFSKKYRPRLNLILVALAAFLFVLSLSTLFGEDPSKSFWSTFERMTGLLTLFHLFAFFLVVSSIFQEKTDWLKVFGISVGVGAVVSLLALLPKIGLPDILRNFPTQEGATLGNTSFLASYLLLNAFLALYLIFKSRRRLKTFSAMTFALMMLGLLSSTGYAAIISFFVGLLLLFLLWLIFRQGPVWQLIGVSFLGIVLLAGITSLFLILQPASGLHQHIVQKFSQSRLIMAGISFKAWQDKPFLGWGPENFDIAFYKYFHPCLFLPICSPLGAVLYDKAHNILFDTLVAGGIFGLLLYLFLFAAAYCLLWRRYCLEKSEFWTTSVFSVLLLAYFLQNLTVFDMTSSYLLFFLILGFIASRNAADFKLYACSGYAYKLAKLPLIKPVSQVIKTVVVFLRQGLQKAKSRKAILFLIQQKIFFAGLASVVFFSFFFFKFVIQPVRAGFLAIKAMDAGKTEERISLSKKTFALTNLGKAQLRDFFAGTLMQKQPRDQLQAEIDFLVNELQKSVSESPLNFRSFLKLGQLYNFYGKLKPDKFSQAESILEKAILVSPMHQEGYWALAETKIALGKRQEAIFLLEKALALEPRLSVSRSKLKQTRGY